MALPYIDTLVSSAVDAVKRSGLLESLMVSGTVSSVGTDGTVTVSRGSDSYPKVRTLSGYLSPTVGDTVTILRTLSGWVCPGKWRTTGPSVESWTPALTNVTLGNGQLSGYKYKIGNMVFAGAKLSIGSTTNITGEILVAPPYPVKDLTGVQLYADVLGNWQYRAGGALNYGGPSSRYNTDGSLMVFRGCWDGTAPQSGVGKQVPASPPGIGGTDHIFTFSLQYPAA